jgi:hypothetical protein
MMWTVQLVLMCLLANEVVSFYTGARIRRSTLSSRGMAATDLETSPSSDSKNEPEAVDLGK